MEIPQDLPYMDEGGEERIYSVSEIAAAVKGTLESAFPMVWVEGELSKVMDHPSGHIYMTLKDEKAALDANLWKFKRGILKFDLERGMKVMVRGRISSYAPYGKYNLIVEQIEPAGIGALQIRFEQLKKKLNEKGYFDDARKKPIPAYPKAIGVVTSESGAAFRDISRILKRRDPGVQIIIAPVLVEGEKAAPGIAQAIDDLNRYGKIDLIIAGRGGGSPESLWAFNEEVVADAIFRSRLPVISAVGHEIDFTIADFVADLRASTPSAAAELAVKDRRDVQQTVAGYRSRMHQAVKGMVREYRSGLNGLLRSTVFTDPARALEERRQWVDDLYSRGVNALNVDLRHKRQEVKGLYRNLKALKPENLIAAKKKEIAALKRALWQNLRQTMAGKKAAYGNLSGRLPGLAPTGMVREGRAQVAHLVNLLERNQNTLVERKRRTLAEGAAKLNSLSPLRVLQRGYSIAQKDDGAVIKSMKDVKEGDRFTLMVEDADIAATAGEVKENKKRKELLDQSGGAQ